MAHAHPFGDPLVPYMDREALVDCALLFQREVWAVRGGPQPLQAGLGSAPVIQGRWRSLHLLPGLVLELEGIWAHT